MSIICRICHLEDEHHEDCPEGKRLAEARATRADADRADPEELQAASDILDNAWEKRKEELGWDNFGNEATALSALRACLEGNSDIMYGIGRNTLIDALHEHKEREIQHRNLRAAAQKLFEWAEAVIGEPDKAIAGYSTGIERLRAAKEAIGKS